MADTPETFPVNVLCCVCGKLMYIKHWPRNDDGTIPRDVSHGICGTECIAKWRGEKNV